MRRAATVGALVFLLAAGATALRAQERWIHIHVDDGGDRVRVNLPLSLVEEVLPLVETGELNAGRLRIHRHEVENVDFKKVWEAVRKAPAGDFVTVEGTDGTVRVANAGGFLTVHVDEAASGAVRGDRVRVKVPASAIDALFAPGGDELDVVGLVRALGQSPGDDLVTVEEGDSTRVRIWIDASPASK
jgi:hypothetical protein